MASTNTLHSIEIILTDADSGSSFGVTANPADEIYGEVDITRAGVAVEDHRYALMLNVPQRIDVRAIDVSLYRSEPIHADLTLVHEPAGEDECYSYSLTFREKNRAPSQYANLFFLTYGLVRIGLSIDGLGDFITRDIPCGCSETIRSSDVRQMLNLLLDSGDQEVADWMFATDDGVPDRYAILESPMQQGRSKSLSSFIRLTQGVLDSYESWMSYFRTSAHCVVTDFEKRLSGYDVRQLGVDEFTWLMRNGDVMTEVHVDTGIEFNGSNYFPRYVRTEVKSKSFNNYENKVIIAFLDEVVIGSLRSAESGMERFLQSVQECLDDLDVMKGEYELPAVVVIEECARHQRELIGKLEELRMRAQRLLMTYRAILPGVEPRKGIAAHPQRTKVFQEVRAYSAIYQQIERWRTFGYFSLARESLALHALRLDKLYEYYCLFRILEELKASGFTLDSLYRNPVVKALYSFENDYRLFQNERTVNSLYHLAAGDKKVSLYYQPVLYWDGRAENGIRLFRKSSRRPFAPQARNACYTPDFLLATNTRSDRKHFILDAKYRSFRSVSIPEDSGYSTFDDAYHKYQADVITNDGGSTDAVWLLVGKEDSPTLNYYECGPWISSLTGYVRSGVVSLSPSADLIHEVFDEFGLVENGEVGEYESMPMALNERVEEVADSNDEPIAMGKERSDFQQVDQHEEAGSDYSSVFSGIEAEPMVEVEFHGESDAKTTSSDEAEIRSRKRRLGGLNDEVLAMCLKLIDLQGDWHDLTNQQWVSRNIKINHPVLREQPPSGRRERRLYELQQLGIGTVYLFSRWRPDELMKLKRYIALKEKGV